MRQYRAVVAILAAVTLVSCVEYPTEPTPGTEPPIKNGDVVRGFGFSPLGFPEDYTGSLEFFAELDIFGNAAVTWVSLWRDDAIQGRDAGEVPALATQLALVAPMSAAVPVPVFSWRSGETLYIRVPGNSKNDWSNQEAASLFRSMVSQYAKLHQPPVIFLGNENDVYWAQDSVDYARWIEAYNQAYEAIKDLSPKTLIGPVFSYEHLAGIGELNGWSRSHWGALEAHDLGKIDVVGLTVYPFFAVADPRDMGDDYFDQLFERIGDKPVMITETGWPSAHTTREMPWEASANHQVAYMAALEEAIDGRDIRVVNWRYLYDMVPHQSQAYDVFGAIGLKFASGKAKPALPFWITFAR